MSRSIRSLIGGRGGRVAACWLLFIVLASLTAPLWRPYDVTEQDLMSRLQGPSGAHWLGTDAVGRDLLSRVFTAGALPIFSALLMMVVAFGIGLPLALVAAEKGKLTEQLASRVAEMVLSLPSTVVLLAAIGAIGNRTVPVMIIFGILIAAPTYRVMLGVAQSTRQRLYVDAARVNGMGSLRINLVHVLPSMARVVAVQAAQLFGIGLMIVSGLAFLGFGPTEPQPSWGFMIKDASDNLFLAPWLMVPAGSALALTVIAANALADALATPPAGPGSALEKRISATRRDDRPTGPRTPADYDEQSLLSVRGATVAVDGGPALVTDVSFELGHGKVLGLVGESGCGKTMTARSILGLLPAGVGVRDGSLLLRHRDLTTLSDAELRALRGRDIAMISQEPMVALDPLFSVKSQLTRPIRRFRGVGRNEARLIAVELLEQVGIVDAEHVLASYPHQLSGGMAQRVAIALALTGEPKLLIADEPTTALDVTVQAEILSLLRSLVAETGMSMVIVSHDLGVVADICDTVAVMYAGQIVESGPVDDVLDHPEHPYTMALLGANPHAAADDGPEPDRLAAIVGTVPPPGSWPIGCRFASRCQFATDACDEPMTHQVGHGTGSVLCARADELAATGVTWAPEREGAA